VTPPRARQEAPKVRRAAMFTGVSAFQMGLIHIIAGMMGAGVFERYPRLRVSFGERGGAGSATRYTAWISSSRTASAT
jgi:uncharacterized protein